MLPGIRFSMSQVLLGLIAAFISVSASHASAENWAEKMFEDQSHDFRTVGRGTKCEYQFKLTNPFEEDVHIKAVRTSCGCTTPTVTKETLTSRETGAVITKFNTESFIGKKSATVTVVFDKPYYAEVQLNVSGFIRTDITFDPPEVAFGEVGRGELPEQEVVITHNGNTNWAITDVRSHCKGVEVRLSAPERTPGIVRYRMVVRMKDGMPEGDIQERLTLISNDRNFPTTEMAISGRVRPLVSVSPAAVAIGDVDNEQVISKRIVVRADEPFAIEDVLCPDARFAFEVASTQKKVHIAELHFTGDANVGQVSQEIRVITDLPGKKSATFLVTGAVQPQ